MEGETSNNDVIEHEASIQRCCTRYKECRRNHAASFGRYAIDGCGEFICCKDDVFICAACGCHRSFHRKDQHYPAQTTMPPPPQRTYLAPLPLASHNGLTGETSLFVKDLNIDVAAEPETLSEAEVELDEGKDTKIKRAKRTRLTVEQKNKMMGFADKIGWSSQRNKGAEIQQFCKEIGIAKRVFVVWLNNNRLRKDSM